MQEILIVGCLEKQQKKIYTQEMSHPLKYRMRTMGYRQAGHT